MQRHEQKPETKPNEDLISISFQTNYQKPMAQVLEDYLSGAPDAEYQFLNRIQAIPEDKKAFCDWVNNAGNHIFANEKHPEIFDQLELVLLGIVYHQGYGREVDRIKARNFFKLAADKLSAPAVYYLGRMMHDNLDGLSDEEIQDQHLDAMEEYRLSSDPKAYYMRAMMYLDGYGVEQNIQNAFDLLRLAAQQAFPPALNMLGYLYEKAWQNGQAKKCYEQAAMLGNMDALVNLGSLYEKGQAGLEPDLDRAKLYYQLAAEKNSRYAKKALEFLERSVEERNYINSLESGLLVFKEEETVQAAAPTSGMGFTR